MTTEIAKLKKRVKELEEEVKRLRQQIMRFESVDRTPILLPGWEQRPLIYHDYQVGAIQ